MGDCTLILVFLSVGFWGLISFVGLLVATGDHWMKSPTTVGFSLASGALWSFANFALQLGFMTGLAGPVATIANTSCVGTLVLEMIFFQPPVHPFKLFGMGICVLGVGV